MVLCCNDERQSTQWILLWVLQRFCNCWRSWPSCPVWQGACRCLAQFTRQVALVARGSSSHPAQLPSLARGLSLPSLARGLLWPSSANMASSAYLAYSPSATYTPSSVYLLYLPLGTYTPFVAFTLSPAYLSYLTLAYLRHWLSCGTILLLSHPANNNIKIWLLHGSRIHSSLTFVFYCCRSLWYNIALGLLANLKETREVKRACRVEATSIRSVVNKWCLWYSNGKYET